MICYVLNVFCLLSHYLSTVVEICLYVKCFVCVVSLSQSSSRDLLCVKCLCVLSRYLSPVVEICCMLNCLWPVVSLSQPSSGDLFICLNVCVSCLVISAQ